MKKLTQKFIQKSLFVCSSWGFSSSFVHFQFFILGFSILSVVEYRFLHLWKSIVGLSFFESEIWRFLPFLGKNSKKIHFWRAGGKFLKIWGEQKLCRNKKIRNRFLFSCVKYFGKWIGSWLSSDFLNLEKKWKKSVYFSQKVRKREFSVEKFWFREQILQLHGKVWKILRINRDLLKIFSQKEFKGVSLNKLMICHLPIPKGELDVYH